MTPTLVQAVKSDFTVAQAGGGVTLPALTQAGNLLVILVAEARGSGTGITISSVVSDNTPQPTWVLPTLVVQSNPAPSDAASGVNSFIAMGYAPNIPGGDNVITVNMASATTHSVLVAEFSGIDYTQGALSDGRVDNSGGFGSPAATVLTSQTSTASPTGNLFIGAICSPNTPSFDAANSFSTPSGWNTFALLSPGSAFGAAAWCIMDSTSSGPNGLCAAWDVGTATLWGRVQMQFAGVSGPPPQTIRPDADLATTGWSTAPLFSKVNDNSDATVITAPLV